MDKLDVIFPQDLDQHFVHLEQREISSDAEMAASSELFSPTELVKNYRASRATFSVK